VIEYMITDSSFSEIIEQAIATPTPGE